MDLVDRAIELKKQGKSINKAVEVLNAEGYKTNSGLHIKKGSLQYYLAKGKESTKGVITPHLARAEFSSLIARVSMCSLKEASRKKILDIILDEIMG